MAASCTAISAGFSKPAPARETAVLTGLTLRDVVLIERLDLGFGPGLTVLTGETGAGKSILLDGLGLALGSRADASLVRAGAEQAVASASFVPPRGHPVMSLLAEHGLDADDALVLRRVVAADGKSRAFINDQPVGVAMLRRVGACLVEVQGQHDQQGLADAGTHRDVLDAFGVAPSARQAAADAFAAWQAAATRLAEAEAEIEAARADQEWLVHQVEELDRLAPEPEEETRLAEARQAMQAAERQAEALAAAAEELAPRDRRATGPAAAIRAALRALGRLAPRGTEHNPADAVIALLERAADTLAEAETALTRMITGIDADPRRLEHMEERLFALRAAARKHAVPVADLPALRDRMRARLALLGDADTECGALRQQAARAEAAWTSAAAALSAARADAARRLDAAMQRELPPLKLERARFVTEIETLPPAQSGRHGRDAVRFLIAANPGQKPGPLGKIASGGELSRLMLALKVVLASTAPLPTLIFDEVDAGIGGATAAAVGERLARLARAVQVLVVTHSPQVAARAAAHFRVAKASTRGRTLTDIAALDAATRREEIARMLAGETITDAARAAADSLLARA